MPHHGPIIVLYDADCGFCRWSVAQLLRLDRAKRLRPEAIQDETGQLLLAAVPVTERLATAHAVTADGQVHSGGDAAAVVAAVLPAGAPAARLLRAAAGPTRAAYGLVASNRRHLGRLVSARMRERADAAIERRRTEVPAGGQ